MGDIDLSEFDEAKSRKPKGALDLFLLDADEGRRSCSLRCTICRIPAPRSRACCTSGAQRFLRTPCRSGEGRICERRV